MSWSMWSYLLSGDIEREEETFCFQKRILIFVQYDYFNFLSFKKKINSTKFSKMGEINMREI